MAMRQPELALEDRLALSRRKAGFKDQKDMADALGVSRALVGFFEQGLREPTLGMLKKWAELCDVSLNWLAGREVEEFVNSIGVGYQLDLLDRLRLADIVPIEHGKKRVREVKPTRRCSTPLPAQDTFSAA